MKVKKLGVVMMDYVFIMKFLGVAASAVLVLSLILFLVHLLFKWKNYKGVHKQLAMILITIFGVIAIVLLLPIKESLRGQILSLLGIIISATLALSSTTLIGNALAGVMIRGINSFRIGDFVQVDEHFGRVSEKGLLHVEIQTEDRNLVTLPNFLLVTKSVKVFHYSGTMVMAEVSLGYDVSRSEVKKLLVQAAERAELKDPFVYIIQLGDFSVLYRVSGLLEEVKHVLSAKSRLHEEMLDTLHSAGVEIVSPNFMNTRTVGDTKFIPVRQKLEKEPEEEVNPEKTVFDKADQAEKLETVKKKLGEIQAEIKETKGKVKSSAGQEEKQALEEDLRQLEIYEESINQKRERMEQEIQGPRTDGDK